MPERSEWLVAEVGAKRNPRYRDAHYNAKNANITCFGGRFRVLAFLGDDGIPGVTLTLHPRLRALWLSPSAFYYQFVVPNRSFIELGRRLPLEQALTAHFSKYVSMHWEKLCRDAVTGYVVNGVVYGKAKRWWEPVVNEDKKPEQVEFDVVAESLDKKHLLVGECKWTSHENSKQLIANLLRKANLLPFAKNHTIVPMLFLKNTPKDYEGNVLLPKDILEMLK